MSCYFQVLRNQILAEALGGRSFIVSVTSVGSAVIRNIDARCPAPNAGISFSSYASIEKMFRKNRSAKAVPKPEKDSQEKRKSPIRWANFEAVDSRMVLYTK